MLAAGLRPSLLAPSTYAIFLLKSVTLPSPLVAVRSLNERIIEHLERNSAINIELLRMLREQESWESALRSLRVETEGWLSHAPVFTATYAPATYVWKRWVDQEGFCMSWRRPSSVTMCPKLKAYRQDYANSR